MFGQRLLKRFRPIFYCEILTPKTINDMNMYVGFFQSHLCKSDVFNWFNFIIIYLVAGGRECRAATKTSS